MLLKLALVVCSRKFVSLNVGRKVFRKISKNGLQCLSENNFVQDYQKRPFFLEHLSLIETTRSWTFDNKRKQDLWNPIDVHAIFWVWTWFYSIPREASEEFETFFSTELLLYKPFHDIPAEIGISTKIIIENWRNFRY